MSPSPFLYVGPSPAGFFPTDTQAEGRFSAPRPIHLPCFAKPLPSLLRALFLSNTLISPGSFSSAFQCTQVSSNVKTTNTKTPPIFPHLYTTIWLSSFSLFTSYQPNCPEELPNLSQGSQDPLGAKTHKGVVCLYPGNVLQWLGSADRPILDCGVFSCFYFHLSGWTSFGSFTSSPFFGSL